ncbi:hypothetical protein AB4259_02700 [Vibrio amylolyticus]|uniref:hypothetical protein n=1 Tax=Vibrio amylolyticus TaxID=2847292 RepID=UPI003550C506
MTDFYDESKANEKMIKIADDFEYVAAYLKQELSIKAFQRDEEHFNTNKINYDYLTKMVNMMSGLKEGI